MNIADKKTKAIPKLYLLVFESLQTNFYWWFGRNLKFREMVKKWVFDFYLVGFCRPAHKSIYRVKENKILSRKLFFPKKIRSTQRSVFGVEKSKVGSKLNSFCPTVKFLPFFEVLKNLNQKYFLTRFFVLITGKISKVRKIHR